MHDEYRRDFRQFASNVRSLEELVDAHRIRPLQEIIRELHGRAQTFIIPELSAAVRADLIDIRSELSVLLELVERLENRGMMVFELERMRNSVTYLETMVTGVEAALDEDAFTVSKQDLKTSEKDTRAGDVALVERALAQVDSLPVEFPPAKSPPTDPSDSVQKGPPSAASDATTSGPPPSPNRFQRSGEFWEITFADKTIHLQDCAGAQYIYKLLQRPREALKATDLECGDAAQGQVREQYSGDEVFDAAGKKRIEAALSDLRERSEKAKAENDIGTQEKLEEEIDALQEQVKRSHGLGRHQRRLGDPNEKARSRVGHAIQATLKRIKKDHPVLHEHFKRAILRPSGMQPCYMPDPVVWWLLR